MKLVRIPHNLACGPFRVIAPLLAFIDFEGKVPEWEDDLPRKYRRLLFDSHLLFGVLPLHPLYGNVWECVVDCIKTVESHVQHYRSKDFPDHRERRHDYWTFDDFIKVLEASPKKHLLIDRFCLESLYHEIEGFGADLIIADVEERAATGLLFSYKSTLVFTDAYLPIDRQWVNIDPRQESGRPQYLIVEPKPYTSVRAA